MEPRKGPDSPPATNVTNIDQLSLDKRIKQYKECCYRAYASGLGALSIATSASYFVLKKFPIQNKYSIVFSASIGCVAGYQVSKAMSHECNLLLKAHRESLRNPVQPDAPDTNQ